MHGLRPEYQDRINFVILDYDLDEDHDLALDLGVAQHPAFAIVAPDSAEVIDRRFGPMPEDSLREWLDETVTRYSE